jgi:hypothetical protein
MAIQQLNYDRARSLGFDTSTSYTSFSNECFDVTFVGAVLDTYERNMRDDSDFYAIVWDEEKQEVRDIEYATTRFATYNHSAHVDATDEVKVKAAAYWRATQRATVEASLRRRYAEPHVGAHVKVIRGRKVPKGFHGTVGNIEKIINPFKPAPRHPGGWDTGEMVALVLGEKASHKVKCEYLEVIPDPERTEALITSQLAEFDANWERTYDISWRSMAYQNLHLAGINLGNYV